MMEKVNVVNETTIVVIIPTLNEENFIGQCLESLLIQTFPISKMDVIVVDGGSTDNTKEIVHLYDKKISHLRIINNHKKIQSVAFNIGVKSSNAPYVIRLDAHVIYDKDYIQKCIEHLQQDDTLGNVGGICNIKAPNNSLQAQANAIANKVRFGIGGAAFRIGGFEGEVETVPFGAFPRSVLDEIGLMREDLPRGEDNEINSRIRKHGYRIWLDPTIKSTYFARPNIIESTKQMYKNGLSIGWLLHIDRQSLRLRHLIPMCFVLCTFLSLFLLYFRTALWRIFTCIIVCYILAALIASYKACRRFGFRYFFILPLLFFCIHTAYGIGTLIGIFFKPKEAY